MVMEVLFNLLDNIDAMLGVSHAHSHQFIIVQSQQFDAIQILEVGSMFGHADRREPVTNILPSPIHH